MTWGNYGEPKVLCTTLDSTAIFAYYQDSPRVIFLRFRLWNV